MKLPRITLTLSLLLVAGIAAAENGAVNVLNKAGSTRSDATGGAATAIGRDATLVWLNPAAIAQVDRPSLTLAGQRGFFGESLGQALLATPLSGGVMAFGCMYYNTGEIKAYNEAGVARTMSLQEDFMGAITYGQAIGQALSVGATAKGLNSSMFDEVSSAAVAIDLGAQYRVTQAIKIGASIQNLGTRLRYLDDSISLPTAVRGGLAYGMSPGNRDLVVVMADAEYPLSKEGITWSGGAEYQWNSTASLRAGMRMPAREELATLSFGAGLVFQQYRLDYSVRLGKEFDSPQTLSLTMDFPRAITATPAPTPAVAAPPAPVQAVTAAPAAPAITPAPSAAVAPANVPLTAPEILPGAPAPLPMAPANGNKNGKNGGPADDLNRELDEILKQTGGK